MPRRPQKPRKPPPDVVERTSEVAILASPTRQEIVDTLGAHGAEASVAELATQLGRPVDGLYYHLRLLARAGLIDELPDEGEGRRYKTRAPGAGPLRVRCKPGKTKRARAVAGVVAGMLRTARRDVAAALADPAVTTEGPMRELWAGRAKGWVDDEGLLAINRLLARLLDLLRHERSPGRARRVSLTWALAPVPVRASRRTSR